MPNINSSFWNKRYADADSVYGYKPSEFFKDQIQRLTPGKLLLPGEGEGRNALYAASLGWNVSAIDFSEVAKEKALGLARSQNLSLDYQTGDIGTMQFSQETYDLVALVYVHLSEPERKHLHRESVKALKVGGRILVEAFSQEQINYTSGGPKDPILLYTLDEISEDFKSLNLEVGYETVFKLDEGKFHHGLGSVIRIIARKN